LHDLGGEQHFKPRTTSKLLTVISLGDGAQMQKREIISIGSDVKISGLQGFSRVLLLQQRSFPHSSL
jgi:hypothetical protein